MPEKWTREYERRRQELLAKMDREAQPFADATKEAVAARTALPLVDAGAPTDWCRTYLPHYFDRPFSRAHQRFSDQAGEIAMPTFLAAFRGFGKSCLLSIARPIRRALSRESPFLIYGALGESLAAQNMDYVRIELDHNARIAADYGGLKTDGPAEEWTADLGRGPAAWGEGRRKGQWSFRECKFQAFGIGMSPRGVHFRQHRPTEFVGDDLETAELARNPQREQHLWDWLMDEVLPALDRDAGVMTIVGTLFGPGCMMERAKEMTTKSDAQGRPLAKHYRQPAIDDRGRSAWPEGASDAQLSRIRAQIGLTNWNRNYALVAEDPTKPFQSGWFGEYSEADLSDLRGKLDVVAFLDPAISLAPTGCPRALIVVGADRRTGQRYILDAWIERGTPREMIDKLFSCYETWRPRIIGIEINGGYALIKPLLDSETPKRGWIPARYVSHSEAKELRIERVAPAMEAGRWLFPRSPNAGIRLLQDQLTSYPDGFVDGPDALAGCDELLPDAFAPASDGPAYKRGARRRDLAGVV